MLYTIDCTPANIPVYIWQSNTSTISSQPVGKISAADSQFLQKISDLIVQNINDASFGNKQLSQKMHLSISQLFRKIKALTNQSTANYIRSIRLEIAMKMLHDTKLSISEIAFKTGFNDPSYFSRSFVKQFGITPGKARKNTLCTNGCFG